MKTRVTLTLEPTVVHRAKQTARSRETSLSNLVESLLEREIGVGKSGHSGGSFSTRWAGWLEIEPREEPRFRRLSEKYGL